jgi:hypothetical protein
MNLSLCYFGEMCVGPRSVDTSIIFQIKHGNRSVDLSEFFQINHGNRSVDLTSSIQNMKM